MLTELEKKIIASIQGDIPVAERPYQIMADKLGISEEKFIELLKNLSEKKFIRRFGATLRHQQSGFAANAMVAWNVDSNKADEAGKIMASFVEVSHCYKRVRNKEWPYNLYTMIHAADKESCYEIACEISEATNIKDYKILFSVREFKKISMRYFS